MGLPLMIGRSSFPTDLRISRKVLAQIALIVFYIIDLIIIRAIL